MLGPDFAGYLTLDESSDVLAYWVTNQYSTKCEQKITVPTGEQYGTQRIERVTILHP